MDDPGLSDLTEEQLAADPRIEMRRLAFEFLLAGGGMRVAHVIGSTNRLGEVPQNRPIHYQEVFAMLYNRLRDRRWKRDDS